MSMNWPVSELRHIVMGRRYSKVSPFTHSQDGFGGSARLVLIIALILAMAFRAVR